MLATAAARVVAGHRLFAVLLVAAAAVRVLVQIAYRPALFFYGDSFAYLENAAKLQPEPIRPTGYPALLRAVLVVHDLAAVPAVQHLLGLATGVLVYALVRRLGAGAGRRLHCGRTGAVRRLPARHRAAHPLGGVVLAARLCRAGRASVAGPALGRRLRRRGDAGCRRRPDAIGRPAPDRARPRVCDRARRPRADARAGGGVRAPARRLRHVVQHHAAGVVRPHRPRRLLPVWPRGRLRQLLGPAARPGRAPRAVRSASSERAPEPELLRVAPVVAGTATRASRASPHAETACSSPSRSG